MAAEMDKAIMDLLDRIAILVEFEAVIRQERQDIEKARRFIMALGVMPELAEYL